MKITAIVVREGSTASAEAAQGKRDASMRHRGLSMSVAVAVAVQLSRVDVQPGSQRGKLCRVALCVDEPLARNSA